MSETATPPSRARDLVTVASLLSILLMTLHMAYDLRQAPSVGANLATVAILVVWLYGTLALGDGTVRGIILILGAILATGVPLVHMTGGGITTSSGYFFVWSLLSQAVVATFTLLVVVRALVRARQRGDRASD